MKKGKEEGENERREGKEGVFWVGWG